MIKYNDIRKKRFIFCVQYFLDLRSVSKQCLSEYYNNNYIFYVYMSTLNQKLN